MLHLTTIMTSIGRACERLTGLLAGITQLISAYMKMELILIAIVWLLRSCVLDYGSMTIIPSLTLDVNAAMTFHLQNHSAEKWSPAVSTRVPLIGWLCFTFLMFLSAL